MRLIISEFEKDPSSIGTIRSMLAGVQKDLILLDEVLLYLYDSVRNDRSVSVTPPTEQGRKLFDLLRIRPMHDDLQIRVEDMRKIIEGNQNEARSLQSMTDTISEMVLLKVHEEIRDNSGDMVSQLRVAEQQAVTLDALQAIFAGLLAFQVLDRITGDWSVVYTAWAQQYIVEPFMNKPFIWFIISMMSWAAAAGAGYWGVRGAYLRRAASVVLRIKVNKSVDLAAFDELLATKAVEQEIGEADDLTVHQRVVWVERDATKWEGYTPRIEVSYDVKHAFLLNVAITVRCNALAPAKLRPDALKTRFFAHLQACALPRPPALQPVPAPQSVGRREGGDAPSPVLQESGVMSANDCAAVIESTKSAVSKLEEDEQANTFEAFIKIKQPGDRFYREIPFGMLTFTELREEIADKLGVDPNSILQVRGPSRLRSVGHSCRSQQGLGYCHLPDEDPAWGLQVHKEPDILVGDDDDVARLKPGTLLEARLSTALCPLA